MTKFTEKAEYLDANSKVRITLDGGQASALVQNAAEDIATLLYPGSIIIGPRPSIDLQGQPPEMPDDQKVAPPNQPSTPPQPIVWLTIGGKGTYGRLVVLDDAGKKAFVVEGDSSGHMYVFNQAGQETIHLDGQAGDIELLGADCAEEFEIDSAQLLEPGMVMVIAEGMRLRPCGEAYDRKVAGVLSGAGDYQPGIVLGKRASSHGRIPIALVGRAYCKVDARNAPIEIGDLLTTSDTLGHAMKVGDPLRAFGAVIGKALRPLREGTGLLPVLIALQ